MLRQRHSLHSDAFECGQRAPAGLASRWQLGLRRNHELLAAAVECIIRARVDVASGSSRGVTSRFELMCLSELFGDHVMIDVAHSQNRGRSGLGAIREVNPDQRCSELLGRDEYADPIAVRVLSIRENRRSDGDAELTVRKRAKRSGDACGTLVVVSKRLRAFEVVAITPPGDRRFTIVVERSVLTPIRIQQAHRQLAPHRETGSRLAPVLKSKLRSHWGDLQRLAHEAGVELPHRFNDAGQEIENFIADVVRTGDTRIGPYKPTGGGFANALWSRKGNAIVIRRPDRQFLTILDGSGGGAALNFPGGL